MHATRVKAWGLGFGIVSSVSFGASGPFGKALVGAGYSPLQASWTRVAGATLILVPLVFALRGRAALRIAGRNWPALVGYGLISIAACQSLYFVAATRLPVGIAILLEFTGPVLVVGWVRFVRRTPIAGTATVGVVIAMIGLACVVEVWSGLRLDLLGLAAGLGAAAGNASFFLLAERMSDVDPIVMTAAGSAIAVAGLTAIAAPWSIPWHVLGDSVPVGGHHAPGWALAAWIIGVSTVVAYLAGVAAVHRLSAPVAGAVGYIEAVSATLIAWVVLGERLGAIQIIGGAIVLTGAFVAQRSVAAAEPPTPYVPVPEPARQ